MTITQDMCSRFTAGAGEFGSYVAAAISIEGLGLTGREAEDAMPRTLQFEVVSHRVRRAIWTSLTRACSSPRQIGVSVSSLLPLTSAANYVSYWHRETEVPGGQAIWAPLGPGQISESADVAILGETLSAILDPARGPGYLHYVQDTRPGDGWTVRVGVTPSDGATLHGLALDVRVSDGTTRLDLVDQRATSPHPLARPPPNLPFCSAWPAPRGAEPAA